VSAVDLEVWWRRVGSAALVGTARRSAPSVAEVEVAGAGAPVPRPDARPEEAALDAAALGGALRRAGRLPSTGALAVPSAPTERVPEAPPRARQLLELLLSQPPTDTTGTEVLLLHWSATCRETGYRVPHALLPALLDRSTSRELRGQVAQAVGERGRWLATQNPAWSWLQQGPERPSPTVSTDGEHLVDPRRWALQSTGRRLAQLSELRSRDPAAGRDLLLTTWSSDSAKDRRALLETFLVNLGPGDEDLLEGALDDRAASVRDLAALLLDGLPESRRASRMAARLRRLISETGRLRRHLEVRLPDDPDAAGRRDGLGKPPAGRSARGWWLERIAAGAPFDAWAGPPDKVVPRIDDPDVLAGLRRAAVVRRDADWARALLGLGVEPELLAVLPAAEREQRVTDQLGRASHTGLPALLTCLPTRWSPQLSAAVVARLARLKPEETGQALEPLMPQLVRGLHPDAIPALQRWRTRTELPRRYDNQLGSLIQSRSLRQTISEAFQT
jgi:hypothetical protein